MLLLQLSVFIKNRKGIRPSTMFSLLTFIVLPLVASLAQIFAYGISLINLTLPLASVLLYLFALDDLNEQARRCESRLSKGSARSSIPCMDASCSR